jgi:hypothetical protein
MFVVEFGREQARGVLASLGVCQYCQTEAACDITVRYSYAGMLWVFRICTGKVFSVCCKHCGKYRQLSWSEKWKASNKLIPFKDRFGLFILIGFAVLFGAFYKGP